MIPETIREIGGWRLLKPLGQGGMGQVWKVCRMTAAGSVLGVMKLPLASAVEDPATMRRWLGEARVMQLLQNCSHVVQLLDSGEDDGICYFVMEFVYGTDLQALHRAIRRAGRAMTIETATWLFSQQVLGLTQIHGLHVNGVAQNILHKDIALKNILVSHDGAVKLADLGIASARDVSRTNAGTPRYMAPEHYHGYPSQRSDVFSSCACAWETLEGEPYRAGDLDEVRRQIMNKSLRPLTRPMIDRRLRDLIMAGLAFDERERPTSMELADGIDSLDCLRPQERATASLVRQYVTGARSSGHTDVIAADPARPVTPEIVALMVARAQRGIRSTRPDATHDDDASQADDQAVGFDDVWPPIPARGVAEPGRNEPPAAHDVKEATVDVPPELRGVPRSMPAPAAGIEPPLATSVAGRTEVPVDPTPVFNPAAAPDRHDRTLPLGTVPPSSIQRGAEATPSGGTAPSPAPVPIAATAPAPPEAPAWHVPPVASVPSATPSPIATVFERPITHPHDVASSTQPDDSLARDGRRSQRRAWLMVAVLGPLAAVTGAMATAKLLDGEAPTIEVQTGSDTPSDPAASGTGAPAPTTVELDAPTAVATPVPTGTPPERPEPAPAAVADDAPEPRAIAPSSQVDPSSVASGSLAASPTRATPPKARPSARPPEVELRLLADFIPGFDVKLGRRFYSVQSAATVKVAAGRYRVRWLEHGKTTWHDVGSVEFEPGLQHVLRFGVAGDNGLIHRKVKGGGK